MAVYSWEERIWCQVSNCLLYWLSSYCFSFWPYKGAANDATIAEASGIKDLLSQESECLLADKMYRHDHISFITPLSGHRYSLSSSENAYNYLIYSARSAVERIICRLSVFGIFDVPWRFSILLHGLCVRVACKLVNLFLVFEPLG